MANTIALFKKYTDKLDLVYKKASCTAELDGSTDLVKAGVNANEIVVPKLSMDGLGDYSRNDGYTQGKVDFTYETVKFNYDRGRKFTVDSMDDEETVGLATINTKLDFIVKEVAKISTVEERLQNTNERLAKVESAVKSAHKRLDDIKP